LPARWKRVKMRGRSVVGDAATGDRDEVHGAPREGQRPVRLPERRVQELVHLRHHAPHRGLDLRELVAGQLGVGRCRPALDLAARQLRPAQHARQGIAQVVGRGGEALVAQGDGGLGRGPRLPLLLRRATIINIVGSCLATAGPRSRSRRSPQPDLETTLQGRAELWTSEAVARMLANIRDRSDARAVGRFRSDGAPAYPSTLVSK
jgi:hypothetical protein